MEQQKIYVSVFSGARLLRIKIKICAKCLVHKILLLRLDLWIETTSNQSDELLLLFVLTDNNFTISSSLSS